MPWYRKTNPLGRMKQYDGTPKGKQEMIDWMQEGFGRNEWHRGPTAISINSDPKNPNLFAPFDDGVYEGGGRLVNAGDWVVGEGPSYDVISNEGLHRYYEER
jgi:hypothetical protein